MSVTNSVIAEAPRLMGAVVDNDTPDKLEITYDKKLATVTPVPGAFETEVNGQLQPVIAVSVTENLVILTLAVTLEKGDSVTVSYNPPPSNPIQTPEGGIATILAEYSVANNVAGLKTGSETIINDGKILIYPNPAKEYVKIANFNPAEEESVLRLYDFAGKLCQEIKLKDLDKNRKIPVDLKPGFFIAQIIVGSSVVYVQKLIVVK
jgi:hypothetical protein